MLFVMGPNTGVKSTKLVSPLGESSSLGALSTSSLKLFVSRVFSDNVSGLTTDFPPRVDVFKKEDFFTKLFEVTSENEGLSILGAVIFRGLLSLSVSLRKFRLDKELIFS